MPHKACAEPTCRAYAEPGKPRCATHASEQRKRTRSNFNSFYASKRWRITRAKFLHRNPLCVYDEGGTECCDLASDVHHVLPLEDGGAPYSFENLMPLCRRHHSAVHRSA